MPARERRNLGGDQVEGRQAVRELLAVGRREVREVWMMEGSDPAVILREIESFARSKHVPVRLVTQRQLQEVQGTEAPQGVVAFAEPLAEADLADLVALGDSEGGRTGRGATEPARSTPHCDRAGTDEAGTDDSVDESVEPSAPVDAGHKGRARSAKAPFLVIVDGVTDPQNLGALLRSAECAGVTGVVIARHRAAHVTPAVAKAAAGAIEHVRIAVVPGIPGALQDLARLGVWTVGLDERGPAPLFDLRLGDGPVALVLGAEGRGLSPLARERCDVLGRIPLGGTIDSLNVSAAGAVAMFEVARQRGFTKR